jgi:acyl-CoA synthetase (AMP-forming)/AMP-acid ligase II
MHRAAFDYGPLRGKWYETGWFSDSSLLDAFEDARDKFPDTPVTFVARGTELTVTIADIGSQATLLAGWLQHLGIRPGDAVAVQLTNRVECAVAYQAVLLCGATLVPIVHIYGVAEVSFILAESAATVFITATISKPGSGPVQVDGYRAIDTLRHIIVVDGDPSDDYLAWSQMATEVSVYRRPQVTSDDVCLLLYTSGTSAAPKGVQHTHNTTLAELSTLPALIAGADDDISLVAFPPGHIAGVHSILRSLLLGSATVFMDAWDAASAASIIDRFAVTSTAGAPIHLESILDVADAATKLTSLREFLVGAAPVSENLGHRAAAAGIATFRSYGATEHPTVTGEHRGEPSWARLRADGKPLPGSTVRILGPDGNQVAAGGQGEVIVQGPEQFIGYRDPALNVGAFTPDGWFRTGDLGYLDNAGRLTITDRIKDVIIRGGETISANQVEEVLLTHPAVDEGAIVAAPDARYGEVVAAVVALKLDAALDLNALRSHYAKAGLAKQKTPERLIVVDTLPRTALGKVKKEQLRREHFP